MPYKSIKANILQLTLLPALLIAVFLGTAVIGLFLDHLDNQMKQRGKAMVKQLSFFASQTLDQPATLEPIIEAALQDPSLRGIALIDHNNRPVVSVGREIDFAPPYESDLITNYMVTLPTGQEAYRFVQPVYQGRDQVGWIVLEYFDTPLVLLKYQGIVLSLCAIFAALLLALVLTWSLNKRITRPIFKLQQGLQNLANGNYTARVSLPLQSEFAQLSKAVNQVAEMQERSTQELQHNIEQSTIDLRETLETIEIQNIELDLARKEALEASRVKSEFLANTSHEIRTPLNGILGFTSLLLKSDLTPQQKEYLRTIEASSQSLLMIINDILDFSRIEAGKILLDYIPFNLMQVIDETLQILAPAAHEKNLQLIAFVDPKTPVHLLGDPLRLKQVLTNLVSNAIKFSNLGNIIIKATAEETGKGQAKIKISVSDAGIGLTESQQKDLFKAFSQADPSSTRKHGGTGLGLAISKGLIDRMDGEIGVNSEPGQGATFWFTAVLGVEAKASPHKQYKDLSGKRVAVLDSNPIALLQIGELCESLDMSLLELEDFDIVYSKVQSAFEAKKPIDVVIIDMFKFDDAIPNDLVAELAHKLHQEYQCRTLLLTTPTTYRQLQAFCEATHLCTLNKPISLDRLYRNLCTLLEINLPVTPSSEQETVSIESTDIEQLNILAVDDNPANLQLVGELLKQLKVNTVLVNSGEAAIEEFRRQQFDLIFMDIQMPAMDGMECTQRLRGMETEGRRTPIIALTAHAMNEHKSRLLLAGMDDNLSKPVSEQDLARAINRWVPDREKHLQPTPLKLAQVAELAQQIASTQAVNISECLRLANDKPDLAHNMLNMLIQSLQNDTPALHQAFEQRDYQTLEHLVHRLHGGSCYCGVPNLKKASQELDHLLRIRAYDKIQQPMELLLQSITQILTWSSTVDINSLFDNSPSNKTTLQ